MTQKMKTIDVIIAGESYKIRSLFSKLLYYKEIEVNRNCGGEKKIWEARFCYFEKVKGKTKAIILFKIQMECVMCYFRDCFPF